MRLTPVTADEAAYLVADDAIDHTHPFVRTLAARLRAGVPDSLRYAQAAFEFVRDAVPHSIDSGDRRIPWRASDVLATRNGICHAKSHALVALLRAKGVHAGFCYQNWRSCTASSPSASRAPAAGSGRSRAATPRR